MKVSEILENTTKKEKISLNTVIKDVIEGVPQEQVVSLVKFLLKNESYISLNNISNYLDDLSASYYEMRRTCKLDIGIYHTYLKNIQKCYLAIDEILNKSKINSQVNRVR